MIILFIRLLAAEQKCGEVILYRGQKYSGLVVLQVATNSGNYPAAMKWGTYVYVTHWQLSVDCHVVSSCEELCPRLILITCMKTHW